MIINLVPKEGAPALAYIGEKSSVRLRCSLRILRSATQLEISLAFSSPNHSDDDKPVILRYEGNNLVPGGCSFKKHDIPLPVDLGRNGETIPGTLCLALKERCSLWYPKKCRKLYAGFSQLLLLARAQDVCIDFDTNWRAKPLKQFEELFTASQEYAEIEPLQQFTNDYQQAHWHLLERVLNSAHVPDEDPASGAIPSIEDAEAEAPPFDDVESDNPPPYAHVSGKRSRRDPSLTPNAHDLKRSCSESNRATPAPPLRAQSTASSTGTVPVDIFQGAVTSAVEKLLPQVLEMELLQALKTQLKKELLQALKTQLKMDLTQVVMEELPQVLEKFLQKTPATHSPSRCLSPASAHNHVSNPFTITQKAITMAVQKTVDETFHETVDESYNSASLAFDDLINDTKVDLAGRKEDLIASSNNALNEMEDGFNNRLVDKVSALETAAEEIVLKTVDRLNELGCGCLVSGKGSRAASEPISKYNKERIVK